MDYIRLGIINGKFNSNGKLPSTREMAKALKLNTNTGNLIEQDKKTRRTTRFLLIAGINKSNIKK
ncbi:hypothetical protein [Clostridium acidisoli]|uniref:hypothetical protein n=1 Tax=Clostridium acidisoli TaxID=91624 RepID=UPI00111BD6A8|nr:hypothetical protein [Clostridium acidisoli]